ncbi:AMP-binding protein, partial [bacterium]|nr:AMP-binding protein [bacterium]
MFTSLFSWCVQGLLWLRYRVEVRGLERIPRRRGTLIMPNHPAEIDPVIVTALFWRRFTPRPVMLEDFYTIPGLNALFKVLRAIAVPNMEYGQSSFKLRRLEHSLESVITALEHGDNVLMYPAGRLWRQDHEVIGGASAMHMILQRIPDLPMVLVRTRGLWGSSFSWAFNNGRPSLAQAFGNGAKALLKNLIFFTPRRRVTITCEPAPPGFPRTGDKAAINAWLDAWYNAEGPDALTLVPYSLWSRTPPKIAQKGQAEEADLSRVPDAVKNAVSADIAKMLKCDPAAVSAGKSLRADLGMDSLQLAEVVWWLDEKFGVTEIDLNELTTVGAVMAIAAGGTAGGEAHIEPAPKAWRIGAHRPLPAVAPGETIQEAFLRTCDRMGSCPACADDLSGVTTFRKLKTGALALADVVRELPGERVGVMLPASVAADVVILGVLLAGKVPVMINWTLGERNLQHVVDASGVTTVLSSYRFIERLDNVELAPVEPMLVFLEEVRRDRITLGAKLKAAWHARASAGRLLARYPCSSCSGDDPAVILFTSGSENRPKGVPLTHHNILSNIRGALKAFPFSHRDVLYGFLPPFHSFGFTVSSIAPAVTGLLACHHPNPTEGRRLARGIAKWKPTLLCGTPTFIKGILRVASPKQLASMRYFVAGAEKAPDDLFDAVDRLGTGACVLEGYGITECSPVLTLNRPGDPRDGVGLPLDGVELRIVNIDSREPLPPGQQGLVLARGPNVFNGYLEADVAS